MTTTHEVTIAKIRADRFEARCGCGWTFRTVTRTMARAMFNYHRRPGVAWGA